MAGGSYHRAYRHLSFDDRSVGWRILASFALGLVIVAFAPLLIGAHARWVIGVLEWLGVPFAEARTTFGSVEVVVPQVPSFTAAGSGYTGAIAVAGVLGTLFFLIPLRRATPYRVLGALVCFVSAASGAFFYAAGHSFPYTTADFAAVWMKAEFCLWLIAPFLFAIALSPLPFSPIRTLAYSATAVAYAMWFSVVRLAVLLALFHIAGLVWFVPAYFLVGFLVDFTFIVAVYSLAVSAAAEVVARKREVWLW